MRYALPQTRTLARTQGKREILRSLLKQVAGSPARLMVCVWGLVIILYFVGPLTYTYPPGLYAWSFIAGCIFTFILGSQWESIWQSNKQSATTAQPPPIILNHQVDRLVRICALVGLIGLLSFTVDKLFLSGLDYSQGITALRYERHGDIVGDDGVNRSFLLYFGYLTLSFSTVSYLLYILKAEVLSRSSVWLAQLSLASPVVLAMLYGGRSPLTLVILLAVGALVIRALSNQTILPQEATGRRLMLIFMVLGLLYNGYIFAERRLYVGIEDIYSFRNNFETSTEATPTIWAEELLESGYINHDLFMSGLSTHFYFTHSVSVLERTLEYDGILGPYYGQYQFYLATTLLTKVFPAASFEELINDQLRSAGIYGWFITAWGGVYLDFGLPGALIVAFAYGWISGQVFRRALVSQDLGAKLVLCYIIGAILFSPITSQFAASNSLLTLGSILICSWRLRSSCIRAYSAQREVRLSAARFANVQKNLQTRQ